MKLINNLFLFFIIALSLFSCNKKIDNPELMEELQTQIEKIIDLEYLIDEVRISSISFSDDPEKGGYFSSMFILVEAPDSSEFLSQFIYSADSWVESIYYSLFSSDEKLRFLGNSYLKQDKKKDKTYNSKPDLLKAISYLEEMKKLIPENYKYENLLGIKYLTEENQDVYEFEIEVEPVSEDISHPDVRQTKVAHVGHATPETTTRKGVKIAARTPVTRKVQHTIKFRLAGDQITVKKYGI